MIPLTTTLGMTSTDLITVMLLLLILIALIFMSWLIARAAKALEVSAGIAPKEPTSTAGPIAGSSHHTGM